MKLLISVRLSTENKIILIIRFFYINICIRIHIQIHIHHKLILLKSVLYSVSIASIQILLYIIGTLVATSRRAFKMHSQRQSTGTVHKHTDYYGISSTFAHTL